MKKNDIACLVVGMALLGSSLAGYGMESNEVIGKQKGGSTQATDKLEQGEYRVSKGAFKECLKHFLDCKWEKLEESIKKVFEAKGHHNHFETDLGEIEESLADDYRKAEGFFNTEENKRSLLEKVQMYFKNMDNIVNDPKTFCKENPKEFGDFLDFLYKEKDLNQELPKHLKKLQGTKNGVFREALQDEDPRSICAQQLSGIVFSFLASQNKDKNDSIRCKFYDRFKKGDNWSYCMAYVDLQTLIGTVYFYRPDSPVEEKPTNTFVMVFSKDSQDSFQISLKSVYPWLGRDAFLKAEDKAGGQNPEKQPEEADRKKSDEKCKGFFGVSLEEEIRSPSSEEQLEDDDEIEEVSNTGNSRKKNAPIGTVRKKNSVKKVERPEREDC
jgi:hypothetical protein